MRQEIKQQDMDFNKYFIVIDINNFILSWYLNVNPIFDINQNLVEINKETYSFLNSKEYWKYKYTDGVVNGVTGSER